MTATDRVEDPGSLDEDDGVIAVERDGAIDSQLGNRWDKAAKRPKRGPHIATYPAMLPSRIATTAAAWLQGVDVSTTLKRRTFYNHAAALRKYGIDISEKRNIATMPVRIKTIEMQAAAVPDWYSMDRATVLRVAA